MCGGRALTPHVPSCADRMYCLQDTGRAGCSRCSLSETTKSRSHQNTCSAACSSLLHLSRPSPTLLVTCTPWAHSASRLAELVHPLNEALTQLTAWWHLLCQGWSALGNARPCRWCHGSRSMGLAASGGPIWQPEACPTARGHEEGWQGYGGRGAGAGAGPRTLV